MKRFPVVLLTITLLLAGCFPAEDYYDATDLPEYEEDAYPDPAMADWGVVAMDAGLARQHLEALAEIGARWSGSAEEAEAGEYISMAFTEMGYAPEAWPFIAEDEEGETIESANIVAVKDGQSTQEIVIGAHYDSSDEGDGIDDNASGVAVLLAVAELVSDEDTPYTISFVAFGGEEAGLLGSTAYVGELSADEIDNIILFINLDSIAAGDNAYIYGDSSLDTSSRDWFIDWTDQNGIELLSIGDADLNQDGEATGDYAAFQEADIPWVYFESTNWDLGDQDGYTQVDPRYGDDGAIIHTQYDTLEYLDDTFPGRIDSHFRLYTTVLYTFLMEYDPR